METCGGTRPPPTSRILLLGLSREVQTPERTGQHLGSFAQDLRRCTRTTIARDHRCTLPCWRDALGSGDCLPPDGKRNRKERKRRRSLDAPLALFLAGSKPSLLPGWLLSARNKGFTSQFHQGSPLSFISRATRPQPPFVNEGRSSKMMEQWLNGDLGCNTNSGAASTTA